MDSTEASAANRGPKTAPAATSSRRGRLIAVLGGAGLVIAGVFTGASAANAYAWDGNCHWWNGNIQCQLDDEPVLHGVEQRSKQLV
jgi:hypothetical protein